MARAKRGAAQVPGTPATSGAAVGGEAAAIDLAIRATDPVARLDALLAAWRTVPDPLLADAIAVAGTACDASAPPLGDPTLAPKARAMALHTAWLARADQAGAAALGTLLDKLLDGTSAQVTERVKRLAAWPPDPRRDDWVAGAFERVVFRASSARGFWRALVQLGFQIRDPRAVARLHEAERTYGDDYAEAFVRAQVQRVVKKLGAAPPAVLSASDAARVRELAAPVTSAATSDEQALLAAIFADPADDGVRLVYADVLSSRGDPRGELIVLASKPEAELTRADRARIAELVGEHFERLAGPLATVIHKGDAAFRRGFLSRCTVELANPRAVAAAVGDPWWSTVEHVTGPLEIIEHPVMRALRSIELVTPDLATTLRRMQPLPAIEVFACRIHDASELTAVGATTAFPKLRRLVLETGSTRRSDLAIFDAPSARRLEELAIAWDLRYSGPRPDLAVWLDAAEARPRRPAVLEVALWRLREKRWGSTYRFGRSGERYDRVEVTFSAVDNTSGWVQAIATDVASVLAAVPDHVAHVRIVGRQYKHTDVTGILAPALARFGAHAELALT